MRRRIRQFAIEFHKILCMIDLINNTVTPLLVAETVVYNDATLGTDRSY